MSIYDSELNPYASIDDYTLDGLYTPIVNVEKQDEEKVPKKVTTDVNPKKSAQRSDSRTSIDSKDMFINPADVAPTTSVSSKDTPSKAVRSPQTSEKGKTEQVSKEEETAAEKQSEGVTEPPKRKRGRPRKVDVESAEEESKDSE